LPLSDENTLCDIESHFIRIGDWNCHYLDEGQGHPVIMLHGNPSWSFMYRKIVRHLRSDFRIIAPDHIGCGLSDKPGPDEYPYTLEARISDFEKFVDALNLKEPFSLMVHDWGGMIGFGYATRYPDRISRLIVCNTTAFHLPKGKSIHWTLRYTINSRLVRSLIHHLNLFARIASHVGCRMNPMPTQVRRLYLKPYRKAKDRWAILRFVQDIPIYPDHPTYPVVSQIQRDLKRLREKPMLICWGERDFIFDTDFLIQWMRRFPRAAVQRFTLGGHYIIEDACDVIGPLVENFLRAPLRDSP
jgi:haloalkane dehalogenase